MRQIVIIFYPDLSSNEAKEKRLQDDPQICEAGRNRIGFRPSSITPAKSSDERHHEDGLKQKVRSFESSNIFSSQK